MKKIIAAGLLASSTFAPQALALGGFEFEVGGYAWQTDLSGEIDGAGTSVKLGNGGIELDSNTNGNVYASFEHPIPFAPNLRVSHTFLKNDGSGTAIFSGLDFNVQNGSIDISHTDITLYWKPVDISFFTWDLGGSARIFDGSLAFTGTFSGSTTPVSARSSITPTYALLYNNFAFELPVTGLGIQLEITGGSNGKETAIDSTAKLEYTSVVGIGAALGYRYLDVDLESTATASSGGSSGSQSITYKLDAHGPFLSLYYRL